MSVSTLSRMVCELNTCRWSRLKRKHREPLASRLWRSTTRTTVRRTRVGRTSSYGFTNGVSFDLSEVSPFIRIVPPGMINVRPGCGPFINWHNDFGRASRRFTTGSFLTRLSAFKSYANSAVRTRREISRGYRHGLARVRPPRSVNAQHVWIQCSNYRPLDFGRNTRSEHRNFLS